MTSAPTRGRLASRPPAGALLAAWATAWLTGQASLDDAVEAAQGGRLHLVRLAAGEPGEPLSNALLRLRALGVTQLRLALPSPGDPASLAGPAAFNRLAIDAGQAVLALGPDPAWGLVPQPGPDMAPVQWDAMEAETPRGAPPWTVREADRELDATLRTAAAELAALDVARWRPELVPALAAATRGGGPGERPPPLPPTLSGDALDLLIRARRLLAVADIALADDGAAVTGREVRARLTAVRSLERTARAAYAAAWNGGAPPHSPMGTTGA